MMRAFSLLLCLAALLDTCVLQGSEKMPLCAGLGPVAHILREVGGSRVTVSSMLPEGRSPHDYAPGTRELRLAMGSKLFFTTNMLYEQRITRAIQKKVPVIDVTDTIKRIPLTAGNHDHHDHHHCALDHHSCGGDGASGDPHVWLSPLNCAQIAQKAAAELGKVMPRFKEEFKARADKFSMKMRKLHETMLKRLAPHKGKTFFVYHPAFGYIASLYGLKQHAIELGGREATPARMAAVIREARKQGAKVVFVQKQFNPASAKALANAIKGEVLELDPLAGDVEKNFLLLSEALVKGFSR